MDCNHSQCQCITHCVEYSHCMNYSKKSLVNRWQWWWIFLQTISFGWHYLCRIGKGFKRDTPSGRQRRGCLFCVFIYQMFRRRTLYDCRVQCIHCLASMPYSQYAVLSTANLRRQTIEVHLMQNIGLRKLDFWLTQFVCSVRRDLAERVLDPREIPCNLLDFVGGELPSVSGNRFLCSSWRLGKCARCSTTMRLVWIRLTRWHWTVAQWTYEFNWRCTCGTQLSELNIVS